MTTLDGKEAAIKEVTILDVAHATAPNPLFMNNKAAGGSGLGLQPGTIDYIDRDVSKGKWGSGLSPIGTLVKTTGKVTFIDEPGESFIYVDDGSKLADGSGHIGVRVSLDFGPIPNPGADAVVTACCGAMDIGGNCARLLRPRSKSDCWFSSVANYLDNWGFESGAFVPWNVTGTGAAVQTGTWKGISAHSGSRFVGVYAYSPPNSGILSQSVSVPAGTYRASVWSRVMHTGGPEENARNRVGIDPTGGSDPNSPNVMWSAWDSTTGTTITAWREIVAPDVTVTGGTCTVFLEYSQQSSTCSHINCLDDATLISVP
jgi:hypothetical protein